MCKAHAVTVQLSTKQSCCEGVQACACFLPHCECSVDIKDAQARLGCLLCEILACHTKQGIEPLLVCQAGFMIKDIANRVQARIHTCTGLHAYFDR